MAAVLGHGCGIRAPGRSQSPAPGTSRALLAAPARAQAAAAAPGQRCSGRGAGPSQARCSVVARVGRSMADMARDNDWKIDFSLPIPREMQQTVVKGFGVGGVGMHTGDYCAVRIMPALAGEGRYFVRVADGALKAILEEHGSAEETEAVMDLMQSGDDREAGRANLELYFEYLNVVEVMGYKGEFQDYAMEQGMTALANNIKALHQKFRTEKDETPGPLPADNPVPAGTKALVSNAAACPHYTTLEYRGIRVIGAEHLLAALEACGVDNARIEVDGAEELPMLDGAALGWVDLIHTAGLRQCEDAAGSTMPRMRPVIRKPVTVFGAHGAFASFVPGGDECVVSCGVDWDEGMNVVGKRWASWSADRSEHFRFELSAAKTAMPSMDVYKAARKEGYYRYASEHQMVVGAKDRWTNNTSVTFFEDEPARHKVVDVLGSLSMLATMGGSGLPKGHVITWKSDHVLEAQLVKEMAAAIEGHEPYQGREVMGETDALNRLREI